MLPKVHARTGRNLLLFLCLFPFLMGSNYFPQHVTSLPTVSLADTLPYKTYLSMINKNGFPLMVGVYPSSSIQQSVIDNEIKPVDNWVTGIAGGKASTIVGTFIDMTVDNTTAKINVETPLTTAWNNGYVTFINFPAPSTSYSIVAGKYDKQLIAWATSYKNFASNGKRFAYLAPMQEMNGEWVTYGKDPANFIRAYKHIQSIFAQVGVPAQSVKWVFAPNGWTKLGLPRFENYYPGDAYVDVVAISAYNWGYCKGAKWEEPETVFNNPALGTTNGHYLDRLRAMAPTKPIFIAETASSSYKTSGQKNASEKDRWLRDAYAYLSKQPSVKAVLYFNLDKECDWTAYSKSGVQYQGYRTGINSNGYNYIDPGQLIGVPHTLP